jgi:hypothetical protein
VRALQQLHARLCTTAETLHGVLADPAASVDGEVTGLEWEPAGLPEPEREALLETIDADRRMVADLTEKLEQLSAIPEDAGSSLSPP